ncbi:MAG: 30S ribosomal protein S16 [Anaerolineae bacterium]|nr:30S ribosomal protein S16 [Anaerolineae bacterium]
MVRIRLRRVGAKKQPSYRVVVADSESPRDGRFIETIGFYNPRTDPPTVEIKAERALHWLQHGAQPSDAVARMLRNLGIMDKLARLKAGADMETLLAELAEEKAAAEKRMAEQKAALEKAAAEAEEAELAEEEVGEEAELVEAEAEVEEAPAELSVEEEEPHERVG